MKNIFVSIFLLVIFAVFSIFLIETGKTKEVLTVFTPVKLGIDLDKNKTISHNEVICVDGIESFSLEPSQEFYTKYLNLLGLSKFDMINMGYLAQDFAQKTIQSKNVTVKFTNKVTSECRYADVKLNGVEYSSLLAQSGFGILNGKIKNDKKYKEHLNTSKKLNLVILNHKSNKYHTLDCEYGKIAHDTVVIPKAQLPKGAIPCKFCHNSLVKKEKSFKYSINKDIFNIPKVSEPPLIMSGGEVSLYVTNFTKHLKPNGNCSTNECKAFVKLINNANESIDIAIYGYEQVPAITTALNNAKNRGVRIRFVYDESFDTSKTYYHDNNIIKNIAELSRSDRTSSVTQSNMLMHNKFIIFDKKTVFTGSMNFSKTGLSGYDENDIVIISAPEVAGLYEKEFEQMLEGKFHSAKLKHSASNKFLVSDSEIEVYFSPQDKSSKRVVELIRSSKHYIYIPTFLITHKHITEELINAKKRGVDVRIIMDANNVYTRNTKHAVLRNSGVPLKIENFAGKLHSKTMIIDDEYIIMGSMNFSNSGENKNDENMLVIKNPRFAKNYKNFFLYLWQVIPDKYLKYAPKAESPESLGSCSDGVDNNFNGKIDKDEELCGKL